MTDADTAVSPDGGDEIPTGRADRGMSPARKVLRDAAIVAAMHAGEPARVIGARYGITVRSVRRVHKAFQQRPTATDQRPMEIIERVLRTYESQMLSFAVVAEGSMDTAPAVAVGALKGHAEALERYRLLLGDIGKLPSNLELLRSEEELTRVGMQMLEALDALTRGEVSPLEVRELFGALVSRARDWSATGLPPARQLGPGSA